MTRPESMNRFAEPQRDCVVALFLMYLRREERETADRTYRACILGESKSVTGPHNVSHASEFKVDSSRPRRVD